MLIAGILVAGLGLALALNVLRSAEWFAAFSRPWPSWLKPAGADYPMTHRIVGVGLMVLGLAFIAVGLRIG
jgi:hypothetical protein